jgi:pimeloyl-ACP methyl ester carboxylesterase
VEIAWETFGIGETPILLLPTWSIIPSRFWKLQVAYLARHHRVVTFDGRGTGRSGRPIGPEAYTADQFSEDAVAVLDANTVPHGEVKDIGAGWILEFRDPDGIALELFAAKS